jgi:uncharacterized protein (TIGR03083 family)
VDDDPASGAVIPHDTIATLVSCWRALSDVGATLSEVEWKAPTDLPGWTVQDNLSHIIGTERLLEGLDPAPSAGPAPDHVRNPIGEFNEREVALRRERPGADVLDEWNQLRARRERTLAGGDDQYFDQPMTTPTGPGTMADFLSVRILDCWLHEQDIRRATHRPGNMGGPAAAHTIDRLSRTLPIVVGKRAACPEGRAVTVRITGPVERTIVCEVHGGRAAIVDAPQEEPLATVTLPTEAFVVLATGRPPGDHIGSVAVEAADAAGAGIGRAVVDQLNMMI